MKQEIIQPERIRHRILSLRGQKVMLRQNLAALDGVTVGFCLCILAVRCGLALLIVPRIYLAVRCALLRQVLATKLERSAP